ncbi:hypothetical protein GY45DRAFT_1324981 [Cubamyces sp. BRFM 1775]|nr:hypothetical protein GY45DRAFT_1324981 [Cubamyces sp. BRFM 1775]
MTPECRTSAFPAEIDDAIFEWVAAYQSWSPMRRAAITRRTKLSMATLCSCALTCRAWLPTSRACLYRRLVLRGSDRTSLERLVRSFETNPWLRTLISELDIVEDTELAPNPSGPPRRILNLKRADDISHTWALILAGKLPSLHTLGVAFPDGLARHPQFVRSMRTFGAVTTLTLEWKSSGTFTDLFRLIAAFPNLRTVILHGTMWAPKGTRPVIPSHRFPPLSRLTIMNGWFSKDTVSTDVTYTFLQVVADSVKILYLDAPGSIPPLQDLPDGQMTLAHPVMPRLHTLHVHIVRSLGLELDFDQFERFVNWVSRSAPALKRLVFHLLPFHRQDRIWSTDLESILGRLEWTYDQLRVHPQLSTTNYILLLCHDTPQSLKHHTMLVIEAAVCVRETISRFEQPPNIKVIWGVLTESLERVYLTVMEPEDRVMRSSYLPPPELAIGQDKPVAMLIADVEQET